MSTCCRISRSLIIKEPKSHPRYDKDYYYEPLQNLDGYDDLYCDEEELNEDRESITELVISMNDQGYDIEDIKDEVAKYLIDNSLYV